MVYLFIHRVFSKRVFKQIDNVQPDYCFSTVISDLWTPETSMATENSAVHPSKMFGVFLKGYVTFTGLKKK